MINELITLANHLDRIGANVAANDLDSIIRKTAYSKATPETIQDFNAMLAISLQELGIPQSLVDFSPLTETQISQANAEMMRGTAKLLNSLTSVPNKWTSGTQAGWVEYSRLAGQPDAGVNPDNPKRSAWKPWAKKNKYEPTLKGMFDFMGDTIGTVMPAAKTEEQERVKQNIGYSQTDQWQAQEDEMEDLRDMDAQMGRDKAEHQRIYDAFVNERSPNRQKQMLSSKHGREAVGNAVAAIEGLAPGTPETWARVAELSTSAQTAMDARMDKLKQMSANRSKEAGNVINTLIKVADSLDRKGLRPEASTLDNVIKYLAR